LILQCGWITIGIPFAILGTFLVDRIGRKPLIIAALTGCCIWLCVEAAMVAIYADDHTGNVAGLSMGVAAAYLFIICYAFGIDVVSLIVYAELFPNHLRSKGIALSVSVNALTDLVYLRVTATAFRNIGWKFYLVSACSRLAWNHC
jgi:MFS family permease